MSVAPILSHTHWLGSFPGGVSFLFSLFFSIFFPLSIFFFRFFFPQRFPLAGHHINSRGHTPRRRKSSQNSGRYPSACPPPVPTLLHAIHTLIRRFLTRSRVSRALACVKTPPLFQSGGSIRRWMRRKTRMTPCGRTLVVRCEGKPSSDSRISSQSTDCVARQGKHAHYNM